MIARPSPYGKPVSLFVTCMIDMIYPNTGWSVVKVLEHLRIAVDFPMAQTCCGQPAFNGGYQTEARSVATQFLRAFQHADVIVTPSGSCAAMVRHEYPKLFAGDPQWQPVAERVASITWEFSEYLVDGLGIPDLSARLPEPMHVAVHHGCHGLRLLSLSQHMQVLLNNIAGITIHDLQEADVCCGFGGLFSVKMPAISTAMLHTKMQHIEASSADVIVTGDASCLTQMNGGLSRQVSHKKVRHVADILAEALPRSTSHAE